ncbi:MAG: hypothetical protein II096_01495, partial [Erysipelotrichaceae bacterium]|nr:hypothetical protein [Erysipelotrichaceae bacterium]
MGFFDRLFNNDKKILDEVEKAVRPVDALKDEMAALSDEQLKAKTAEFKQRLAQGETLDDIQVEAFAVAREAA